jgi:hypothetical protein
MISAYAYDFRLWARKLLIIDAILRERERRVVVISRAYWMGRRHFFE